MVTTEGTLDTAFTMLLHDYMQYSFIVYKHIFIVYYHNIQYLYYNYNINLFKRISRPF